MADTETPGAAPEGQEMYKNYRRDFIDKVDEVMTSISTAHLVTVMQRNLAFEERDRWRERALRAERELRAIKGDGGTW